MTLLLNRILYLMSSLYFELIKSSSLTWYAEGRNLQQDCQMAALAGVQSTLPQEMSTFLWKNHVGYICSGKAPPYSNRRTAEEMKA